MLIALAITALLLTATMVAIDASFHAYAVAAQSASSQTATRMVTHRLLALVRTSTAHGPLLPDPPNATLDGDVIESNYIELLDAHGRYVRVEYRSDVQQLWVVYDEGAGELEQPLLGGVTEAVFHLFRRTDSQGVLVLERGSMDLTVQPDQDNTMQVEVGNLPPIRIVASTMPRKLQ
ncbi:MAG: hypothetical protein IT445_09940 [Phycisphaeraceae bacterium]|nr:hypothetical protein [Phycisphaeraceae bacterium]